MKVVHECSEEMHSCCTILILSASKHSIEFSIEPHLRVRNLALKPYSGPKGSHPRFRSFKGLKVLWIWPSLPFSLFSIDLK